MSAVVEDRRFGPGAAFLTPDGEFRFGNAAPVRGRADIVQAVSGLFAVLASCRHRMTGSWRGASNAVCEGEVSCTLAGGAAAAVESKGSAS